jgi:hypothetical protein
MRQSILPILPGTAPYEFILPPSPDPPTLHLSRPLPVHLHD